MIQYIIAAGIGAFLGSRSKKSKKSYAHGGYVKAWLKDGTKVQWYDPEEEYRDLDRVWVIKDYDGQLAEILKEEDYEDFLDDLIINIESEDGFSNAEVPYWELHQTYAEGGYLYQESDDRDAEFTFQDKKEVNEFIKEHNRDFETYYKSIDDFNKGEEYRKITKSYAEGGYLYQESDDRDAEFTFQDKKEVNEFIKEHNRDFETYYKSIDDFNKGEEYRKITKSYAEGGEIKRSKGSSGRYHILSELKGQRPSLYVSTNDKKSISKLVKKAEKDLKVLTNEKHNIFVTDSVEDREIYNFAKGGMVDKKVIDHTNKKIKGWYKNAKQDHGVVGRGKTSIKDDEIIVDYVENGKKKSWSMAYYPSYVDDNGLDYFYNVWMEQA